MMEPPDLGADDIELPGGEHETGKDEFGETPQTDVQQAADRRAGTRGDLFGGPAYPVRQHRHRYRAHEEHGGRPRAQPRQHGGERHDEKREGAEHSVTPRRGRG